MLSRLGFGEGDRSGVADLFPIEEDHHLCRRDLPFDSRLGWAFFLGRKGGRAQEQREECEDECTSQHVRTPWDVCPPQTFLRCSCGGGNPGGPQCHLIERR